MVRGALKRARETCPEHHGSWWSLQAKFVDFQKMVGLLCWRIKDVDDAQLFAELLILAGRYGVPNTPVRITRLSGTEKMSFKVESNFRNQGRCGYITLRFDVFGERVAAQVVITKLGSSEGEG
jgi:hypothetical protein